MEEQVRDALLHWDVAGLREIDLDTLPSGRVSGMIVAEVFEGLEQMERQDLLHEYLNQFLGDETQYVSVILTYSPREMRIMQAA